MNIHRLRSFTEYQQHAHLMRSEYAARASYEKSLLPRWRKTFNVMGYSHTAGQTVKFHVDYIHQNKAGLPNWRERLVCPLSQLNNRMRASVHLFEIECAPYSGSKIYISEQIAPLYKYFSTHYGQVTGSEYLGKGFAPGALNSSGIRHEDLTKLSFKDASFEYFLSFDCFEHIPDYTKAFSECRRVLAPGGVMFFSVPFAKDSQQNVIRARMSASGMIEHIMEQEYHGDPMSKEGCLCYQYFGWEMLDELRSSGFKDAYAMFYWSKEFGYLGGEQLLFVAKK